MKCLGSVAVRRACVLALMLATHACALTHAVFVDGGTRPDGTTPDRVPPGDVPPGDVPGDRPPTDVNPCTGDQTLCGSVCVALDSDPAHCGTCTNACMPGYGCQSGLCTLTCPAGQTMCSGRCVTTGSDPTNCGTCGHMCMTREVCSSGTCTTMCTPPQMACGPGVCADVSTDAMNCGTCGHACAAGLSCVAGTCMLVCPTGQTNCGGRCVNLATDAMNCMTCGHVCTAPAMGTTSCVAGACAPTCSPGYHACGTPPAIRCEADDSTSACGPMCIPCVMPVGGTVACTGGACMPSCTPPARLCTSLSPVSCRNNDNAACGASCAPCPTVANGSAMCNGTTCVISCNAGYTMSGGTCVSNCGNGVLDSGEACDDGNTASGDGCSATCTVEPNVIFDRCSSTPQATTSIPRAGVTQWYTGTTTGADNAGDGGPSCHGGGPEVVMIVRPAVSGTLTAVMTPMGSWNLVARGGAPCPGAICVNAAGDGGAETISFPVTAGMSYYVIVDGYDTTDHGNFTVSIRVM